ncbi:CRISPR/Cas system-associated protein [Rhizobium phage RHph_X2_24]|nr:CRISPR/Cas system-associated protein [Rhizobium phage RHph_X2_24]
MLIVDATNLPRLMNCNGSRLMQADPVLTERDDTIRNEGNAVHWLASAVFHGQHTVDEMVDRKAPNGVFITADMAEHVTDYLTAIRAGEMEVETTFRGNVWQINGRADHIRLENLSHLYINDFKYGYSIVEPENNWTLIAHAIGFCLARDVHPEQITFTIHQPRAPHRDGRVRDITIDRNRLWQLYAQINETLTNPSDTLQTGKHCYKCPAFASCPARQAAELNGIEAAHTAYNAAIDNIELTARMDQISRAMELLKQSQKAYEELATYRIKKGEIIGNYTVENDLTNRVWKDGVNAELMLALTGINLTKPQLVSPRQAEQAGVSSAIVDSLSERRIKGAKLVRVNANKKAAKLFGTK